MIISSLDRAAHARPLSLEVVTPFMALLRDGSAETIRGMKVLADSMSEDGDDMSLRNSDVEMTVPSESDSDFNMSSSSGRNSDATMSSCSGNTSSSGSSNVPMPDVPASPPNEGPSNEWILVKGKKNRK